jgi:predicted XRE-type DNA-binding protein
MESATMPTNHKVTRSSGNVFKDIGLPNAEQHAIKAKTVSILAKLIEQSGLTQSAAAERIGIKQPDLSKLLRGSFSGFSLERLLLATNAMGADFEIKFKEPATERRGRADVVYYVAKRFGVSADTVRKVMKRTSNNNKKSARRVREHAMTK